MARPTLDELRALVPGARRALQRDRNAKAATDGRRHHAKMIRAYGTKDELCRDCTHLKTKGGNVATHYGCELSALGLSHSAASDWRKKWQACGRFTPRAAGEGGEKP